MDKDFIIQHMNDHHRDSLRKLVQKFTGISDVANPTMVDLDTNGLDITYNDNKTLRLDFPQTITPDRFKDEIIALCKRVSDNEGADTDTKSIQSEIESFKKEFGSVVLATLGSDGRVISSYAPLIQYDGRYYIYISSAADHYHSISANPSNIEALFLEDECKAKSVILRKRLRYKAKARFVERESEEFEKAFGVLEDSMNGYGGVKQIKQMLDFSLIELVFVEGRFVKGFGQAYDIKPNGVIEYVGATNPHTFKK
ncbi:MAG: HugZ family heme oxygenase [Helicobacter sp.]|nr:HugZ family heme oxygenase [Helicobacter sp.]MDY5740256.1 HugZ family heme oxygenase [Helicobacter sp.]